jgi:hypothetical protein
MGGTQMLYASIVFNTMFKAMLNTMLDSMLNLMLNPLLNCGDETRYSGTRRFVVRNISPSITGTSPHNLATLWGRAPATHTPYIDAMLS